MNIRNRSVSVGGILQTAFRFFGKFRKACKFIGNTDWAYTGEKSRASILSDITGANLPITWYMKIRLPSSITNDTSYTWLAISKVSSINPDRSRIVFHTRITAGKLIVRIATVSAGGTASVGSYDSGITAEANGLYEVAGVFGNTAITNAANIGYTNNVSGGFTASSGTTFIRPSELANEDHSILIGKSYYDSAALVYYAGTIIDVAIFPSAKTLAECKSDIATAPFRIKFNNGVGNTLTNSGTAGSGYNLTASGITESSFHTLIQE
jgi:hypothetical protein